jgi:cellulose synthase/poly-beta-1,6-N-acetylglucosamine synthase-like glycosyltransferase
MTKINEGKSSALNVGAVFCRENNSKYMLTVDADTLVDTNALEEMTKKLNPEAAAVTCMIGIANGNRNLYKTSIPLGILTRIQWLDYLRTFVVFRNSMKDLDAIIIMPGACSLINVDAVFEIGGWSDRTLTEDMDMTLMLQRYGMKIQFLSEILAWTQVPGNLRDTGKQRTRWSIGMLQNMWIHPTLWFQKGNKALTYFMMPFLMLTELISPLLELACVTLIILGLFGVLDVPVEEILKIWVGIAMTYMVISIAVIEFVERKLTLPNGPNKLRRLILVSIFEGFTYHFIFLFWKLKAFFLWARGIRKWDKVDRLTSDESQHR